MNMQKIPDGAFFGFFGVGSASFLADANVVLTTVTLLIAIIIGVPKVYRVVKEWRKK
jgi:hypothetical protein